MMKFLLFTFALFLALFAFDTSTDAACGGGGAGGGLFGRGLFGSGPISRMRARFSDRRAARTNASFSATYSQRATSFGTYGGRSASFSSTYQTITPSTQLVPMQLVPMTPDAPQQAPAPEAKSTAPKVSQAPPVRTIYQAAPAPRVVMTRQVVRTPMFSFAASSGCANGNCAVIR